MSQKYYAVEYKSGIATTTGLPNKKTGRYSKAVDSYVFSSKKERDNFVDNGKVTSGMRGNCRKSVNLKELRYLHKGLSLTEFDEMLEMLN